VPYSPAVSRKLLLALVLLVSASVHAAGLYTGQVPVDSQSDADRAAALKNALAQVVIRVSGDPGALARPELAKAVGDAERYVQQFQYDREVVTDASGQPQGRLTLVAQFDRDAVDRLLGGTGAAAGAAGDASAAAADSTPGEFRVWVGGIRSALDYARLIGGLSANERIHDLHVEMARGDGVQLRLGIAGPLARVLDALNAGPLLHVTNAKPPVDGLDAMLELKP
jgi:hypothetical protein